MNEKAWEFISRVITIIGLLATVFSCVIGTLAFLVPQQITQLVYQISSVEPEIRVVPAIPSSDIQSNPITTSPSTPTPPNNTGK